MMHRWRGVGQLRHRAAGKPESPAATATMPPWPGFLWFRVAGGGTKERPKKKEAWQNNKGVSRMVQDTIGLYSTKKEA